MLPPPEKQSDMGVLEGVNGMSVGCTCVLVGCRDKGDWSVAIGRFGGTWLQAVNPYMNRVSSSIIARIKIGTKA